MAARIDHTTENESEDTSGLLESTCDISPEIAKELVSVFNEKKNVNIVVTGRTGVGKSTLIASLLPNVVTKVQQGPTAANHEILEEYYGKIGDSSVTLYDTRGFCSIKPKKKDAKLLVQELRKKFGADSERTIDLLIFCQEMFERFDEASLTALTLFGSVLKADGWKVCIIALTKANLLPPTVKEAEDPKKEMLTVRDVIKQEMQKKYFSPHGLLEVSHDIPFIPVGYKTKKTNETKLPCSEDSIEDLVQQCIIRCNPESVSVIVLAFTREKIVIFLGVGGSVVAGAAIGAALGGAASIVIGGLGAVPGALVGAAIGALGAPAVIGTKSATQAVIQKIVKTIEGREKPAKEKKATKKQLMQI